MTSDVPFAEVIGDPIAHSKSPLIHGSWLEHSGTPGGYRRTRVTADDLPAFVAARRSDPHWRGCNVTMPLKGKALALADEATAAARQVGAANILRLENGRIVADNSDVAAIARLLLPHLPPGGGRVCLIGTGGAARAALAALQQRGTLVTINARDRAAANLLLQEFGNGADAVGDIDDAGNIQRANAVINATPLGMAGYPAMPQAVLDQLAGGASGERVVFDMVTEPADTPLLKAARQLGLPTVSGVEMLLEQAAESFAAFFGTPAPRSVPGDDELLARLSA